MLDTAIAPELDRGTCPHLAVLLRSRSELPRVLASFYALGAKRRGWLAHRSVRGEGDDDRRRLTEAGLDVAGLVRDGQLVVVEFDPEEPPERSTDPWLRALDEALQRGYSALWYARFAVGPDELEYVGVAPFERAWQECFAGRPVVTLCPYIVGGNEASDHVGRIAGLHDGVLVPSGNENYSLLSRA